MARERADRKARGRRERGRRMKVWDVMDVGIVRPRKRDRKEISGELEPA
jgi:hypothetical protein